MVPIKADHLNSVYFLLPGFPGLRSKTLLTGISNKLTELGSNASIIDYPGLHDSQDGFTFSRSIQSSHEWVAQQLKQARASRITLIGHSWGGFVALSLARTLHPN